MKAPIKVLLMGPKRVLSIWLPHLAIERLAKDSDYPPDAPVVLPSRARTASSSMR